MPEMNQGPGGAFPATRHSVVSDLGSVDPERRAAAYEALARTYWRPVYVYIRLRWRRSAEDAQDLTQEFFTRAFEREYLSRYDPAKARFRTFVRTCLDGFLANEDKAAGAPQAGRRLHHCGSGLRTVRRRPGQHARSGTDRALVSPWWIRCLFADAWIASPALRRRGHGSRSRFHRYDIDGPTAPDVRPTRHSHGSRTRRVRCDEPAGLGAPCVPRHRPRHPARRVRQR